MNCPDCGHEVGASATFCPHCGIRLEGAASETAATRTGAKMLLNLVLLGLESLPRGGGVRV